MNVSEIIADPVEFIKRLKIRLKDGTIVSFGSVILPQQIDIIRAIHENKRVAIVKSRQLGVSTVIRAYCFWEAFTQGRVNSAIISNKQRSASALLDMDRGFFKRLPDRLQARQGGNLWVDKANQISFLKGSVSAFSGAALNDRGYTINTAHLSEFAFFDNADDVLASTIASVSEGRIIIESTPNHWGDHLHKIARDKDYSDAWKIIMLPWSIFPDYKRDCPEGFKMDTEEEEIAKKHLLSQEQIYWRRCKIDEMKDVQKFKREYPLDIEEAYSLSDKNYFTIDELKGIKTFPLNPVGVQRISGLKMAHKYVLGVDPAGGVGGDFSVARLMDVSTQETIAIISSNTTSLSDFTEACVKLAGEFNKALIVFEANNHGSGFKQKLDAIGYYQYKPFTTTAQSKLALYDLLRTNIYEGLLKELDDVTFNELRSLIKKDNLAPTHPEGGHDDRVISLCLCLEGLKHVVRPQTPLERLLYPGHKEERKSIMQNHPLK